MPSTQREASGNRSTHAGSAHPAPARDKTSLTALWFGLLGAPLAWSVQTLVNFPVAAHGCYPRLEPLAAPLTNVRALGFVVSIAAIIVCAAAGSVAWRSWRRTQGEHHGGSGRGREHTHQVSVLETGEGRTRFMAYAGIMTSAVFLLVSVMLAVTVFVVTPCGS